MTVRPWQRPSVATSLGDHEGRLRNSERNPPGRWIYAGTYPGDPNTTFDSPPFQNGISGFLRFRLTRERNLQVEADVTDMTPGDVVVNVAALYRPPQDGYAVDTLTVGGVATGIAIWKITTAGDLIYMGAITGGGPGSDTTALHSEVAEVRTWVYIEATGFGGPNSQGIELKAPANLVLDGRLIFNVTTGFDVNLDSGVAMSVVDSGSNVALEIDDQGDQKFTLPAGRSFYVQDSSSSPMLSIDEGAGITAAVSGDIDFNVATAEYRFRTGLFRVELVDASSDALITVDDQIKVTSVNGEVWLLSANAQWRLTADGNLQGVLGSGKTLTIKDSGAGTLLQLDENSGAFQVNAGGGQMIFDAAGNFQVNIPTGQAVSFWDNTFAIERFAVDEDGAARMRLGAGKAFTLYDSSGNPMLQMTEGSPDLHIPTGGSVIADL